MDAELLNSSHLTHFTTITLVSEQIMSWAKAWQHNYFSASLNASGGTTVQYANYQCRLKVLHIYMKSLAKIQNIIHSIITVQTGVKPINATKGIPSEKEKAELFLFNTIHETSKHMKSWSPSNWPTWLVTPSTSNSPMEKEEKLHAGMMFFRLSKS